MEYPNNSIKETIMVIYLLFDTPDNVKDCKKRFNLEDYEGYVSWCQQFRRSTDNQKCRLIPVAKDVYDRIAQ